MKPKPFMLSLSIFDYNSGRSQMGKGTEKRRRRSNRKGSWRRKRGKEKAERTCASQD